MTYVVTHTEPPKPCLQCKQKPVYRRDSVPGRGARKIRLVCPVCRVASRWKTSIPTANRAWNLMLEDFDATD